MDRASLFHALHKIYCTITQICTCHNSIILVHKYNIILLLNYNVYVGYVRIYIYIICVIVQTSLCVYTDIESAISVEI